MDFLSEDKQDKSHLSEWVMESDKNNLSNWNVNRAKKEIYLNSCNDFSELKQSYSNTNLKNISINFGFPNTRNTYKYKNTFPLTDIPMFEQRNIFYYDKDFQLFKNKSVSKYGEKKNKNNNSVSQYSKNNRIFSPQHKIITSIRKKKYVNDKELENLKDAQKKGKDEKDVYELEIINQVLCDDEESEGKNKKNFKNSPSTARELENEWGEIEQDIFENEKDKKNNLLNSIYVEIEKENGDKQCKIVEISKEEKNRKEPCIKIKYSVEDRICLNSPDDYNPTEEQTSNYDKETMKDSAFKSLNYKTNTNSTSNINYSLSSIKRPEYSTLKKENVSEILLKESKSTQNIFNSSENEKLYFSGTNPSTQKTQKYTNYKRDFNLIKDKKKIDSIKPVSYNFEKEEEISPIKEIKERRFYKGLNEEKTAKLMDIIDDDKEIQPNKSIEIEEKYFKKEKEQIPIKEDINEPSNDIKKQKNFFEENKEQINEIQKEEKIVTETPVREEITIKTEKEVEQSPVDEEKINNKGYGSRFRVKEKELEKKEIIYDRNKILKEKKIQELEIEKEREKKSTKPREKSFDEDEQAKTKETFKKEIIKEKEEIREVKGLRDKYRNKNKKELNENLNEPIIVSANLSPNKYSNIPKEINPSKSEINIFIKKDNYNVIKPNKEVKEEINISKKDERETSEKPRGYQKRLYKGKDEEENIPKDIVVTEKIIETKTKVRRFGVKDENKEKEEDYKPKKEKKETITSLRYDNYDDKDNAYNINVKKQINRRFITKEENIEEKPIKTEEADQSRHRHRTFQNKKKLEELNIKEEPIKQIRRWKDTKREDEEEKIRAKKKEEERKEKERIEKEKEKERIEKEKKKERERTEKIRIENERKEKERKEKERREKEEKERKEKERIERERIQKQKEKEEKERKEKERLEREKQRIEKEKERERIQKQKEERERKEKEKLEREKKEKEREEKKRREKEERERKERERLEQLEIEKKEREKKEKERLAQIERERKERERLEQLEREKKERERKERERKERERLEQLEREKKEREKKEKERLAQIEREKKEKESKLKKKKKKEKEKKKRD